MMTRSAVEMGNSGCYCCLRRRERAVEEVGGDGGAVGTRLRAAPELSWVTGEFHPGRVGGSCGGSRTRRISARWGRCEWN